MGNQTETNTAEEISLCSMISGLEEPVSRPKEGPVFYNSCNGIGYCVLPPLTVPGEEHCLLKLDVGNLSWVLVSRLNCHFVSDLRVCNSTMYLPITVTWRSTEKIFYFDEATEKVEET